MSSTTTNHDKGPTMGTKFSDVKGQEWNAAINVGALRRVLAQTSIDLTKLFDEKQAEPVRKLIANPLVMADVLFAIVEPQATARGITADAFGELLEGEALVAATDAVLAALVVFFSAQNADMGKAFAALVGKYRTATNVVWERAAGMMAAINPTAAATEAFDKALASQPGGRLNCGP